MLWPNARACPRPQYLDGCSFWPSTASDALLQLRHLNEASVMRNQRSHNSSAGERSSSPVPSARAELLCSVRPDTAPAPPGPPPSADRPHLDSFPAGCHLRTGPYRCGIRSVGRWTPADLRTPISFRQMDCRFINRQKARDVQGQALLTGANQFTMDFMTTSSLWLKTVVLERMRPKSDRLARRRVSRISASVRSLSSGRTG